MDNLDSFMNAIVFIAGAYLIYSAIIMKTRGEVGSALLGRDIDWEHAKEENKKAYLKVMIPANIVMGIVMLAMGAVFTFEARLGIEGMSESVMILIGLVVLIIYGSIAMHLQSKYLK